MEDDVIDQTAAGYVELARRLEAYADLRLSPSSAATTRMRTAVMNAAHRRAALILADATFDAAGDTTSARAAERATAVGTRVSWRRPAVAIFAAVFMLAIVAGTTFGARPGGPLYAARLWAEMANLPAGLVDRAEAEANRLEARLQEAQQASSAADVSGTEAALAAYSSIVIEAANGAVGDPTASATLQVTVTRQVAVLTQMVDSVPSQARSAVEQALAASTRARDELDSAGKDSSDQHPATDHPAHSVPRDTDHVVDADDVVAHDPWATKPGTANRADPGAPAANSTTEPHKPAKVTHDPQQPPTPQPQNDKSLVNSDPHAEAGAHGRAAGQARP